jgi:hypothetical protein
MYAYLYMYKCYVFEAGSYKCYAAFRVGLGYMYQWLDHFVNFKLAATVSLIC